MKAISIFGEISPPITIKRIPTLTKKCRSYFIYGIIVSTPHWLIQLTKTPFSLPFISHFQSTLLQHIFVVSNDGIEWSLDFGPDSVTLTVKDLVQELTKSSQEIPLADWSLLLSQRQKFLNNHLARVPVTPNQQGTHEMRDEVISSVGAQDMDTSGYQVSDMDDVEFYWENDQLDVDPVFRPGIDTPFSQKAFDDWEMGGSAENPILLDEEEDKENSPPTTKASEIPALLRSRPFGTRIKNVPDYVYRKLFQ